MTQSPSTSPTNAAEPPQNKAFPDADDLTLLQAVMLDSEAGTAQAAAAKPRSSRSALVWLFRLLVLGAGGSFAVIAGMTIAHFYPAQTQEIPFVERLLNSSESVIRQIEQLPRIWRGKTETNTASSSPATSPVSAASGTSASSTPDTTNPANLPLTAADRQKLQAELMTLQQELAQITDRAAAIENRLGTPNRSSEITARLQAIQQQLDPSASRLTVPASPNAAAVPPAATRTLAQDDRLMVTLPSDALFEADQVTLKSGTEAILNSIISDLNQYPGATIRVTAHVDSQSTEAADRARSFQQAKAIEQYLGSQLKEGYHWLVEGYGHSRPVAANDTPDNRQRNRRIEIIIEPK